MEHGYHVLNDMTTDRGLISLHFRSNLSKCQAYSSSDTSLSPRHCVRVVLVHRMFHMYAKSRVVQYSSALARSFVFYYKIPLSTE